MSGECVCAKHQTSNKYTVEPEPGTDVNYLHRNDKERKKGRPKINVIFNRAPDPKKPEEEMLFLKTIKQITPNDNIKHTLEVEFKAPRNYIPLPEPGPQPPIIIPKQPVIVKKSKPEGKSKRKRKAK